MQGVSLPDRELLDTAALCGHLIPAGSMLPLLTQQRNRIFPDELFADLFESDQGRPSIPTDRIAVAMILKELEGLSDRQATTALETDIGWKAAAGMALDEKAFDPSVFVYWRKRLNASDRPHRIDEAVKEVVRQTGVLNSRKRRGLDTTILDDAVDPRQRHPTGRGHPQGQKAGARGASGRGVRPRLRQGGQARLRVG